MFSSALRTARVFSPLTRSARPVSMQAVTPHSTFPKRSFTATPAGAALPKAKKSNVKYYVAGGLLFFGVVCAEDMYNYPDGLLSQSELFPYIVDCLNSLTDSFNDALQPTSDELLPEWPTAPCYAGKDPLPPVCLSVCVCLSVPNNYSCVCTCYAM